MNCQPFVSTIVNGGYRLIERRDGMQFQVGDRVRLSEGRVERLAN